jgi:hypothetical protein
MVDFKKSNLDADQRLDSYQSLMFLINSVVNNVNTAELVKVIAVDEAKKEIDVIPIVAKPDSEGQRIEPAPIYGVKYIEWQYGTNAIIATPVVNDIGLLVVCTKDVSSIESGLVGSYRRYNLADGIYFGGLCGFNATPTQFIKFDENGIEVTSPTALTVNAPIMTVNAETSATVMTGEATVTATGNVAISGSNVAITGSAVSIGSGSGGKAVVLDGDPVYNGQQQQIGTVKATSTAVTAN